jgi:hypothetical protein
MQRNNTWAMFAFGFSGIFVITQMYGLNFSRLPRGIILGIFTLATLAVFS